MPVSKALISTVLQHSAGEAVFVTPIPRLTLIHATEPTAPVPAFYEPSFCAIIQGRKTVRVGTSEISYGAGEYLVAGFDVPVLGAVTQASSREPYVCVQVCFDRGLLLEIAEKCASPNSKCAVSPISIARTDESLVKPLERLVRLLDEPNDAPVLAELYEREILYRLLSGPHGDQLRLYAYRDKSTAPVERAIAFIRDTFTEEFSLQDLLNAVGQSQSSLYRDFKNATGLSPLQYRTRLRLQEVRRLMLAENLGAGEAGYVVGYDSPSQLTREYKRLYGHPPHEEVARVRAKAQRVDAVDVLQG